MVLLKDDKFKGINLDDLTDAISKDPELRAALVRHIAKNHAEDYLSEVNINARAFSGVSARFISSNKEWQE